MPSYLKEQKAWRMTLDHLYNEYHSRLFENDLEIIKGQYIQVYEKDNHCGGYQFDGKVQQLHVYDIWISITVKSG